MLNFIGTGSCFNIKDGNNSCYYYNQQDNSLLLIDCGESTFEKIMKMKLLENAKSVDILITHLHSDHAGSLASLLFACEYIFNIRPNVIYPQKNIIENYLKLTGNEEDKFDILNPEQYKKYILIPILQEHSKKIDAFAYLLKINGKCIFYSGDSHGINSNILERLNNGEIDYFYQDVTKYENSAHMNIDTLNNLISPMYKKKVICMHFDDDETKKKAQELGFQCAKSIEINKDENYR